ncbi:hypothetical protein A2U01_0041376, partial [Trifolium medium]|nr:hypothetical protein [Trifolium medium]
RPDDEANVYTLTGLTLGALWTGMKDHTICTLLHFDHTGHHELHLQLNSSQP